MSPIALCLSCAVLSTLFEVQTVHLDSDRPHVFLAPARHPDKADIFVLDGLTLEVYPGDKAGDPERLKLDRRTVAVDVADVDGDRCPEVIGLEPERVVRYDLDSECLPGGSTGSEMFAAESQLGQPTGRPATRVVIVNRQGRRLFALPGRRGFRFYTARGVLVGEQLFPRDAGTLSVHICDGLQAGPAGALEARVDYSLNAGARALQSGPDVDTPTEDETQPEHARDLDGPVSRRSWFHLETGKNPAHRVRYTVQKTDGGPCTVLKMAKDAADRQDSSGNRDSNRDTELKYPGTIALPANGQPDFNGDGYTDLMLWMTPKPGYTLDALTRTVLSQTWPINLRVHLFDRGGFRHDPRPTDHIECPIPLLWHITPFDYSPLRHFIVDDFDGDGRSDAAFSTAPDLFQVWIWNKDEGFDEEPNFVLETDEPLLEVIRFTDLSGDGRPVLALRTGKRLYFLRPTPHGG